MPVTRAEAPAAEDSKAQRRETAMTRMKDEEIRERLRPVKCFLLDMDGTFYLGDRLIEGSLDFLETLRRKMQ